MMSSHGSLNAVKMLEPSYSTPSKYASDFHALRSLISLCLGAREPTVRARFTAGDPRAAWDGMNSSS
jgi:hypothetical protein